ncbi:YceI family protein [Paracnuella aquatica]|uniref:YceI family protein n=1 Tax=Paracnuella aquatica TaxID=2268757 RepID=UPI000DEF5F9A|nr:YceI family protein [Paracnuella aquatica]RPD46526.1 YceI family protein [Paracnuella aquatica]
MLKEKIKARCSVPLFLLNKAQAGANILQGRIWLFVLLILALTQAANAQNGLFATPAGKVSFFSKAPLEDIEAENNAASSLLNTTNNEVSVRIPVNKFEFPNDLMQEHFNDDFLETAKYPVATFKGKINEVVTWNKPGTYTVTATGVLNIHGVAQQRTIKGTVQVAPNSLRLESAFVVKLADFNIKIPTLLFQKISEQIEVKCLFVYGPYK